MFIPRSILVLLVLTAWGIGFFLPVFEGEAFLAVLNEGASGNEPAFWSRTVLGATLLGGLCGFPLFGFLSDLFGRYRLLLWSLVYASVFSLAGALAWSMFALTLSRFFLGAACGGVLLAGMLLAFEGHKPSERLLLASLLPVAVFLGLAAAWLSEVVLYRSVGSWRLLLLLKGLPGFFALLFLRFHDEPRPWKLAVRDHRPEDQALIGPWKRLRHHRPSRGRLLTAILLTGLPLLGLACLLRFTEHTLPSQVRRELFPQYVQEGELGRDALLLNELFRYPELLPELFDLPEAGGTDAEDLGSDGWLALSGVGPSLPDLIFQAIIRLHAASEPINPDSVADRAAALWFHETRPEEQATSIPLETLESFQAGVRDYFAKADEITKKAATEDFRFAEAVHLTGPDRWRLRKDRCRALVQEWKDRRQARESRESRHVDAIRLLFFLGALPGAFLFYGLTSFAGRTPALGVFFVLAVGAGGYLYFGEESFGLRLFLAGFAALPLLAAPVLVLPRCFPTSARGTATGSLLGLIGFAAWLVFLWPL